MNWQAQWIWCSGAPAPRNQYVLFRRVFRVKTVPASARLYVSADSRYRLYVNGEWLGDGPPRSWPQYQTCDAYEVAPYLKPGNNVLAVVVHHFGESTFQYILGRGGLWCQLDLDGCVLASDARWRVRKSRAWQRPTARISCQLGFEEQFDARQDPPEWTAEDYNDTRWARAKVIGPAGTAPWHNLVLRDIPFLVREPAHPVRVVRIRPVRSTATILTLDTRGTLFGGDKTANTCFGRGAYFIEVLSPIAQQAQLLPSGGQRYESLWLNGRKVALPEADSAQFLRFRKGSNLLCVAQDGNHHWSVLSLAIESLHALRFRMPGRGGAPGRWKYAGPYAPQEQETWLNACQCTDVAALGRTATRLRPVPAADHIPCNAYDATRTQREIPGAAVRVDRPAALLTDTADWTVVHPGKADTELLVDFGRELVGYLEFDLDAPSGTILDWLCFEAIEDGRIHYPDGNQNALRYICREGRQRFVSFVRHGFRYAFITLREHRRPVRLRMIRALLSTYAPEAMGAFSCSDPLLNQVWEVGRHTLRLCAEDTFTDCPGYEQTYWVGDGRNEALISYAAWGPTALARRCVELVVPSLERSALPESQVPSGWQNILPAWGLLWVLMVHEYYLYSGDLDCLRRVYPAVRKALQAFQSLCTDHDLLSIKAWNLFDWAPQDTGSPTVIHNSLFLVGALERAEAMARAVGRARDIAQYVAWRRRLVTAINRYAWSDERRAYVDALHTGGRLSSVTSQQTNSLALLYGVAPPARAAHIAHIPAQPAPGMVAVGSPFAMFYIFEALAKAGQHEVILQQVRERWGMMLEKGATSFWEVFPGFDRKWWTRSHCHAWSSAPTYFLTTYQLGIEPLKPGFVQARIAPQPADLSWAEGTLPTPQGPIHVSWRREPTAFSLRAALPVGVTAEITLPVDAGEFSQLRLNGKLCTKAGTVRGVGTLRIAEGHWRLLTGAGADVTLQASRRTV